MINLARGVLRSLMRSTVGSSNNLFTLSDE